MQTLTGVEYVMADIACKHDKAMEKKTWDERIAHFKSIDFDDKKLFKVASNPIGLRAATLAYADIINKQPSGFMISLDASSSGLQILSLLVSCPKSYDLCGGVHDTCVDSYTAIYSAMKVFGVLTRKQVKQAIMTAFYGSTAMPEYTFGENLELFYATIMAMAPGAWDLNLGLQELWDDVVGDTYNWVLPDNFHACIETQDKTMVPFTFLGENYDLPVKVNSRPKFHKGLGPNLIHSIDGMIVREMYRRCMFNYVQVSKVMEYCLEAMSGNYMMEPATYESSNDKMVKQLVKNYKDTGFLSARIIDYIDCESVRHCPAGDLWDLVDSLPMRPFDLVSVHDCFRSHPNYGNDLRRQYNTIMADINDSTILQSLASMIAGKYIKIKKAGKIDRDLILNSNYMLA
jgi:hypothetical protein